jgi:autotransporter-associated beta strand protein
MKTRTSLILLALAVLTLGLAGQANAAVYFTDAGGPNPWDTTTANWATTPGGTYDQLWVSGDAHFEGTAGTVNVATPGGVTSITFDVTNYILSGGTITMTGAGGNITTGAGTDTISSAIAGSVGLTKQGAGTLILSSAQSYAGPTIINNGTLQLQGTPTGFQYYRFTPTAYRGGGGEQLSELQFFLNDTWTAATTVTAPGNNSPGNEQPPNANDNDTGTKWYTNNRVALIYDFG